MYALLAPCQGCRKCGDYTDRHVLAAFGFHGWVDRPVEEDLVRETYDLMKWGPTSANSSPARFVWVRSADGKATLAGLAAEQNKPKILAAPVTVIIGHDLDFAGKLPKLMPHAAEAMQKHFAAPCVAEVTAMRNGTLQGAYLIVAARALGLDCGPMSGFDNAGVDKAFFSGTRIRSNFICSIGYGDPASVFPHHAREQGRSALDQGVRSLDQGRDRPLRLSVREALTGPCADFMSTSPMGANKPIEDIEATLLAATKLDLDELVWWAHATMAAKAAEAL